MFRRLHQDADAVATFDHAAIDADVLDARLRILLHHRAGGEVGARITAGRPGRDRELEQIDPLPAHDVLLAGAALDRDRLQWRSERLHPFGMDRFLVDLPIARRDAERGRVELARGAERVGGDRGVEAGDVLEQNGVSTLRRLVHHLARDAGDLPILVDRRRDPLQLSDPLEMREQIAQQFEERFIGEHGPPPLGLVRL